MVLSREVDSLVENNLWLGEAVWANGEGSSVIGAMAIGGELDDGSVMAARGGHNCTSSARAAEKRLV